MKAIGIIGEFNPFHSGHAFLIEEARQASGADFVVAVMSGDFVQRGEPAVFDKYTRAEMALKGGADLVFELPVRFCLSSAGDFARGGVLALASLGIVTDLYFGSECGDLAPLMEAARVLWQEETGRHPLFSDALQAALRDGLSYPAARAQALSQATTVARGLLEEPNNILGIEYCHALLSLELSIRPHTILRDGQHYHSGAPLTGGGHPSATAMRHRIHRSGTPHLCLDDFSDIIGYALLREKNLEHIKDISPGLAGRIQNGLDSYQGAARFVCDCQTRAYTESRIRRALLQCVLGLAETDFSMPYLRLLAMSGRARKHASSLLGNTHPSTRLLVRLAADTTEMDGSARSLFQKDLLASGLYRQIWQQKYRDALPNEYQRGVLSIPSQDGRTASSYSESVPPAYR